jgi:hypothetical protein
MLGERGISVVVEASLVLAVLIPTLLFFSVAYTRHALHATEAEHMEKIKTAFFELKSAAERLSLEEEAVTTLPLGRSPVPNIVPLLPLIIGGTSPGAGELAFDNSAGGRLIFRSQNSEYPNLQLVYENGAVLLVQEGGEIVLFPPAALAVKRTETENLVYLQSFELVGENFEVSGGEVNLRIKLEDLENLPPTNIEAGKNLDILFPRGRYENAWWNYLASENSWLAWKGYEPTLTENGNYFCLTIPGPLTCFERVYTLRIARG